MERFQICAASWSYLTEYTSVIITNSGKLKITTNVHNDSPKGLWGMVNVNAVGYKLNNLSHLEWPVSLTPKAGEPT